MAGSSNLLWLTIASFPILLLLAYQVGTRQTLTEPNIDRSKIAVAYAGISAYSHLEKAQPLATGLVEAGYPVTFITGEEFRNLSEATGAHFEPLDGPDGMVTAEEFASFLKDPGDGDSRLVSMVFINHMQEHLNTIQRVFKKLQLKYEKIVYIHDTSFLALLPVQLGAPGILPTVSMALGIAHIALDSDDTYPFPATQIPDKTENARRLHRQAYQDIKHPVRLNADESLRNKLKEMKAIEPYPNLHHAMGSKDDYLVQIGLPEFEYNRSDLVPKLRFLGLPEQPGGFRELPLWWQDVLDAKAEGKKIVVVSQGTANLDLRDLLIPTVQALEAEDNFLVVAATVSQEPVIEGLKVPANARLVKYVPFDLMFQQTDLLITTGGFGTVLQAIKAGVPMVLAGLLQDKAHVATLAEHVGIAVNLKTNKPSIDTIKIAVRKILGDGNSAGDPSFKSNISILQRASTRYDPVKCLDAAIIESVLGQNMR